FLACWCLAFFFFSSRRRHTRFSRDWSSDVCSSDLVTVQDGKYLVVRGCRVALAEPPHYQVLAVLDGYAAHPLHGRGCIAVRAARSEERRVGKEWSSRVVTGDFIKRSIN